jgi:hypothetical protein
MIAEAAYMDICITSLARVEDNITIASDIWKLWSSLNAGATKLLLELVQLRRDRAMMMEYQKVFYLLSTKRFVRFQICGEGRYISKTVYGYEPCGYDEESEKEV